MSLSQQYNMGASVKAVPVLAPATVTNLTSDGTPNAVEVEGRVIDRLAFGRRYLSAKLLVPWQISAAASSASLIMTTRVLHATSTSSGDFSALGTTGEVSRSGVTALVTTGTSTSLVGVHVQDLDLRTARRYLKVMLTPNLAASSSGALRYGAVLAMGGADELLHSTSDAAAFATTS